MSSWRVGAMWLFGIISVSDGLDGWVARITGKSKLGAVLDPAADKLLMLGATVSLTFFSWKINGNSLPTFWVALVLLRDSLITLLSTSLWLKKFPFKVQSTLYSHLLFLPFFQAYSTSGFAKKFSIKYKIPIFFRKRFYFGLIFHGIDP